jgi:hypothetical protein
MKLRLVALFLVFSTIVNGQKFYTIDIDNFYQAFDLACNDTTNAVQIFDKYYFKKETKGLKDFYKFKIKDKEKFSKKVIKGKEFYASIRRDIENVSQFENSIIGNFNRFKEVYSKAEFGDIYFVVGRLSSNGMISKNGLIIGTEYLSKTENNSKDWNSSMLNNILDFNHIPITVFHEMIHFNQNGMIKEDNLLSYAFREGGAEFITELVTGKTDGDYKAFQNREIIIWEDFKKEMYQDKFFSWRDENEPLRPRNALYWAGYLICKSYYDNSNDKQQAVYDILNVKNNSDFYKKSMVEDYIIKHFK